MLGLVLLIGVAAVGVAGDADADAFFLSFGSGGADARVASQPSQPFLSNPATAFGIDLLNADYQDLEGRANSRYGPKNSR